jgi:hypothetical protein
MLKRCSKCTRKKRLTAFNKDKSRKDGRFPWCKLCHREHTKQYRQGLPREELCRRQAEQRAKRDANVEARAAYLTYSQIYGLKRRYGVSVQDLLAIFRKQKGVCAICKSPPTTKSRGGLHVDHDHTTKKVRGLLCNGCNIALGHFRDDPARLRAALRYLRKAPGLSIDFFNKVARRGRPRASCVAVRRLLSALSRTSRECCTSRAAEKTKAGELAQLPGLLSVERSISEARR